ncbi:MAG: hypothetical protein V7637_110 [Mycobacteriales bacterium]
MAAGGPGRRAAVDAAWAAWLDTPRVPLWTLLARWREPAAGGDRELTQVALVGLDPAGYPDTHPAGLPDDWAGALPDDWAAALPARGEAALPAPGAAALPDGPAVSAAAVLAAFDRARHPLAVAGAAILANTRDGTLVDAACAVAAGEPDGRLARFCVEHGLAPADPTTRAAFFVLTGQVEQYRSADPDGSALALAYAGASGSTRQLLREAMVAVGELDVVRVVAGRAERAGTASPAEVDYLATRLAARADWAGLWRLLTATSPARAIALWRRFPPGWQPGGMAARRLAAALAAVPPSTRTMGPASRLVLRQNLPPGHVLGMSIAPGADELAVLVSRGDGRRVLARYTLPSGERLLRLELPDHGNGRQLDQVLDLGAGTVLLAGRDLVRVADGTLETIGQAHFLAATPAGFAALQCFSGTVSLGSAGGTVTSRLGLPHLEISTSRHAAFAADAGSGRLAVAGDRGGDIVLMLLDPVGGLLATGLDPGRAAGPDRVSSIAFTGPDQLISTGRGGAMSWQRDGNRLIGRPTARGPDAVPGSDPQAAERWATLATPSTAALVDPDGLIELHATITPSVDGRWLAVAADEQLRVYWLGVPGWLGVLLDRPLARLTPVDLAAVPARPPDGWQAARGDGVSGAGIPAVADAVLACLEYRFGTEIELGTGPSTVEHDIWLSRPDGAA